MPYGSCGRRRGRARWSTGPTRGRAFPLEQFIPEMAKMVAQGSDYTYAESFRRMVLT